MSRPDPHPSAAPYDQQRARRPRVHRDVVSFVRRSARMNPLQRKAWDIYHERWVLAVPQAETETSIATDFSIDLTAAFGRDAPLIVEIGPGMGDSLVGMARERSEANVLAFEVYQPGVARILSRLAAEQVENVRVVPANAVDGLTTLVPPAGLDELWTFFPDPWHKVRHHKRRLLSAGFADLAASRLRPGGLWRLATDWEDYAGQMRDVLDDHAAFGNEHVAGWAPRWSARPVTRFEQRGIDAGRHIFDLTYRRR